MMRERQLFPCCLIYLYFEIYGLLQINKFGGSIEPVKPSRLVCYKKEKAWHIGKWSNVPWLTPSVLCGGWHNESRGNPKLHHHFLVGLVKWVLKRKSQRRKEKRQLCTVHQLDKARCNMCMCDLPPIKIDQCFMTVRRSRNRCLLWGEHANSTPSWNPAPDLLIMKPLCAICNCISSDSRVFLAAPLIPEECPVYSQCQGWVLWDSPLPLTQKYACSVNWLL